MLGPRHRSSEPIFHKPNSNPMLLRPTFPTLNNSQGIRLSLIFLFVLLLILFSTYHVVSPTRQRNLKNDISSINKVVQTTKTSFPLLQDFQPHCVEVLPPGIKHDGLSPQNDARSFCLTSAICISPRDHSTPAKLHFRSQNSINQHDTATVSTQKRSVSCRSTGPSLLGNLNKSLDCDALQKSVHCAHGQYNASSWEPVCPQVIYDGVRGDEKTIFNDVQNATHLPGIVVIIPPYPWLGNIFHFAQALLAAVHITSTLPALFPPGSLPTSHITLVFRTQPPSDVAEWHRGMTEALIEHRLKRKYHNNLSISILSTYEEDWFDIYIKDIFSLPQRGKPFCAEAAVLLGMRNNIYLPPFPLSHGRHLWPFVDGRNGSSARTLRFSVPIESILFRAAVYEYANISTNIPFNLLDLASPFSKNEYLEPSLLSSLQKDQTSQLVKTKIEKEKATLPTKLLLDLPPAILGYSRRNTWPDPPEGKNVTIGPTRRFSDNDEAWFVSMLKEESRRMNVTLTTIQTPADTPFKEQIDIFHNVGFIAGIHGANLMNMIAMPTFGGVFEISATKVPCYADGSNSGLGFWSYKPLREATVDESRCADWDWFCNHNLNWRRIMIEQEKDRLEIRKIVKQGLKHLCDVRKAFHHLNGIPVVLDIENSEYTVDWTESSIGEIEEFVVEWPDNVSSSRSSSSSGGGGGDRTEV